MIKRHYVRRRMTPFVFGTIVVASAVAGVTRPSWAGQDNLSRAKQFYDSANYEEALSVLNRIESDTPSAAASPEIASYEVFCLLALGRSDEATHAIESIVRTDPLYHPSETEASPRVLAFFEDARKPLLPEVIRKSYSASKDAFDHKDVQVASAGFSRVIALIDELGPAADPGLADLRTLANGFRELSRNATAPPPAAPQPVASAAAAQPPVAAPAPVNPANAAAVAAPQPVAAPTVYSSADAGIVPPIATTRTIPTWHPSNALDAGRAFRGSIELLVTETGTVSSAAIVKSVNASYDPVLLQAARKWVFRPATRAGIPVPFRLNVDIQLGATDAARQ